MQVTKRKLREYWHQNTLGTEYTLHQLSPYIGKLKSSIAKGIILHFTNEGETIYDPYCGACTIPLEACILRRNVIANDLNPYAYILSLAKLNPPEELENVLTDLKKYSIVVEHLISEIDLRKTPKWIRDFFHPATLREILAWNDILKKNKEWFLLSCMLGILHHQRPGFLSYPSSHSVPYLRIKKFPPAKFPHLYKYRNVYERLKKKVTRAFKRMPMIDKNFFRICTSSDSAIVNPKVPIDAIITSPPYMRSLDYARDNRLRLWFLVGDLWKELDKRISPTEKDFLSAITAALNNWKKYLKVSGKCILILGDSFCKSYNLDLPEAIEKIAIEEVKGYKLLFKMRNLIPDKKRVRKNLRGNKYETILVLEKSKNGKKN